MRLAKHDAKDINNVKNKKVNKLQRESLLVLLGDSNRAKIELLNHIKHLTALSDEELKLRGFKDLEEAVREAIMQLKLIEAKTSIVYASLWSL